MLKTCIRSFLQRVGLHVQRLDNYAGYSLLGLKNLPIRSVFDIGANRGEFAKIALKSFPQAHIWCFEPLPGPVADLNNIKAKNETRITVVPIALSDREGASEMFLHSGHDSSSSLQATTQLCEEIYPATRVQSKVSIKTQKLDAFFLENRQDITDGILIKIDVQGHEAEVIKGGEAAFSQAAAVLVEICLDQLYEGAPGFGDIFSLLTGHGLSYAGNTEQFLDQDGHAVFIDALFVRK